MLRSQRQIVRYAETPDMAAAAGLLDRIYAHRGVFNEEDVSYRLDRLESPGQLGSIDQAAELLVRALESDWRILVIGDFDADGATSSALALRGLRAMGARQVDYLVPDRFKFGYGLTPGIVAEAASRQPDLIITVDNGVSSLEGVDAANALGIRVLVTDHHLPGLRLPAAEVIVNPNLPGDPFPSKHLAGVGVMFYVLIALRGRLRETDWFQRRGISAPNLARFLDLVALGTVADVVKLDRNNRLLVDQGLKRIRNQQCVPGISAILNIAGRNLATVAASDLGFAVGPRLNAAGRLSDMSLGIECLLADNPVRARALAAQLDSLNRERREIEAQMQDDAMAALQAVDEIDLRDQQGLCLYDSSWHIGVVGILASRIKDRVHRPVIAFAPDDAGEIRGSARSVPGIHIRDVLDRVASTNPGLLSRFGGHAMAAGLSLPESNYEAFSDAFSRAVAEFAQGQDLEPRLYSDGELNPTDLNLETALLLRDAGPWGQGFPEPLFDGQFDVMERRIVGEKHAKFRLRIDGETRPIDAIAFNQGEDYPDASRIHIAYRLDVNEYGGRQSPQLIIEQIEAVAIHE